MAETASYKMPARIDGGNASKVEKEIMELVRQGSGTLEIDMVDTKYTSSAGLRVLLLAQKEMRKAGREMLLLHVSDNVREIFDVTGFSGFLHIES